MVSLRRLNRQTKGSVDRALEHEAALTDLYAAQLTRAAGHASAEFRRRAHVQLSAAVNPEPPPWVPPDPDELTTEPLDQQAQTKARRIHLQALVAAAPQAVKDAAAELGISFDVGSPFVAALLDKTAARAVSLTQETRDVMRKTLGQAYSEGWSVTQTADMLQAQITGLGKTTAVMQARTDLVGLGNGASLLSAQALGEQAPPTKIWLTAGDELVRPTHADAEGQEVPLDQPFQVGDDELAYPGDPDGSDAEVCNCRCTLIYSDGSTDDSLEASAGLATSSVRPIEHLPSQTMGTDTASPEVLVAGASGDTGLKLSGRDESWDADAAKKSLDPDDYPKAFFWRDPDGDPKTLAAYKLPFAKRTQDGLVAVWRGVTAAAQRLSSTDIPDSDKDAVRAKIGKYYAAAAKQFDDPAIETPWAALVAAVTITVDDESESEPDGDEAEAAPVRWRGILCVEGEDSQDGPGLVRVLSPGGGTWRTPPLPLGVIFETPHADEVAAPICGAIDTIYRNPENMVEIWGEGWINQDDIGCRAAELVANLSLRGISIDPYVAEMDILEPDTPFEVPEVMDGEGETVQPTRVTFKRYVIGGATICPFQALESAQIAIVAAAGRPEEEPHITTLARIEIVDPSAQEEVVEEDALIAAAGIVAPPREWFETQEPPGPMPLTVTDDGRVFGHLALWDSCHTGLEGACIRPPRSPSSYAYFHVGELDTSDGARLAVGKLMIAKPGRSGKHASIEASRLEAARHYDDNTAVGAYVRVTDGRYGPWAAGCVRPGLSAEGVAELKANPPSGDWRRVNGSLDLIAALSVPVPGFPVPRADISLVASGGVLELSALIASSGPMEPSEFVLRALERAGVLPKPEQRLSRPQAAA